MQRTAILFALLRAESSARARVGLLSTRPALAPFLAPSLPPRGVSSDGARFRRARVPREESERASERARGRER